MRTNLVETGLNAFWETLRPKGVSLDRRYEGHGNVGIVGRCDLRLLVQPNIEFCVEWSQQGDDRPGS